jgi:hypothetical protein
VIDSIYGVTEFRSSSQSKQLGKRGAFGSSELSSEGVFKLSASSNTCITRYHFPCHAQQLKKLFGRYSLDLYELIFLPFSTIQIIRHNQLLQGNFCK